MLAQSADLFSVPTCPLLFPSSVTLPQPWPAPSDEEVSGWMNMLWSSQASPLGTVAAVTFCGQSWCNFVVCRVRGSEEDATFFVFRSPLSFSFLRDEPAWWEHYPGTKGQTSFEEGQEQSFWARYCLSVLWISSLGVPHLVKGASTLMG